MQKANKMPIQLDKILENIAQEKVLHPNYPNPSKKEVDDAWTRVGKNNKLSVHEARSIFKVLQKKFEQEKQKDAPSWKLFSIMEQIHRKVEVKVEVKTEEEPEIPVEEDEEYEMLEVQEEEDQQAHAATAGSTGSNSDGESPTKSNSSTGSPEKDERPLKKTVTTKQAPNSSSPGEAKKLLNTMASASPRPPAVTPQTPSATAAALHKKGITVKKTGGPTTPATGGGVARTNTPQSKNTPVRAAGNMLEVGKTIQLPDSIKRKLSEEHPSTPQIKKIHVATKTPSPQVQHTTTAQLMQVKQEREDQLAQAQATASHGINLITIPANPTRAEITNGTVGVGGGPSSSTAATVASTSTNGFSPRIEEIDFRNDIIFDSGNSSAAVNGTNADNSKLNTNSTDIINLGNFDNSLPPTFFKNLCNSGRHEALGLYVANVMNRLRPRSAAKLELGILRAIIDVQSDELEQ